MTDYTKSTNFATKDALSSGNALKIVKGTELNTEFDNIQTAVATKSNATSPTFTGTMTYGGVTLSSSVTGTGKMVLDTSPTLATPVLGIATATSINKLTVTAPATSATLTVADGASLVTSGAYSLTLTSTADTNVTLPTTGTLTTLAGVETFTNKTLANPKLSGSTSGTITLSPPAIAGINTATLPASTGNVLLDVARSLTNNGYLTLSDGLILQWGRGTASSASSGTSTSVTFATANIAFPTSCFAVWVQLENLASGGGVSGTSTTLVTALSATAFTWQRGNSANSDSFKDFFWFAIGN